MIKKAILSTLLLLPISCTTLDGEDPMYIVSERYVQSEFVESAIPVPMETIMKPLDIEQRESFVLQYGDPPYYAVPFEYLTDPAAPKIPLTLQPGSSEGGDPNLDRGNNIVDAVVGAVSTFFPGFLPFAPLLAFLFKRPRRHAISATKKLTPRPGDTSIDLFGATADIARAFGLIHSTKDTEKVFEDAVAGTRAKEILAKSEKGKEEAREMLNG